MSLFEFDVFINAPFDPKYKPIFDAVTYAVMRYGYRARCALEVDDSSQNRLAKICKIIKESKFGIHDISRTECDGNPPLPRFNMPLELGLFLGAKEYGGRGQKQKCCLVLDREKHRFQKFISDISGQDIHAHAGKPKNAVLEVTTWLRSQRGDTMPGGAGAIWNEYQVFKTKTLKDLCQEQRLRESELSFPDFTNAVSFHISRLKE
jgi:hypothetical protein